MDKFGRASYLNANNNKRGGSADDDKESLLGGASSHSAPMMNFIPASVASNNMSMDYIRRKKELDGGITNKKGGGEEATATTKPYYDNPPPEKESYIETEIQRGDTLQALALKYNVHLAEIKRINNILTDGQFFALKRIKIPVKPLSLLHDILLPEGAVSSKSMNKDGWIIDRGASSASPQNYVSSSSPMSELSTNEETSDNNNEYVNNGLDSRTPVYGPLPSKNTKKVRKFLKSMDKDLARIREKQEDLSDSVSLKENEEIDEQLLFSASTASSNMNSTTSSKSFVSLFFVLLVIAVIVILIIARLTFIPLPTDLEEEANKSSNNH